MTPPAAGAKEFAGVRVTPLRVLRSEWTKFISLRSTYYTMLAAVVIIVGLGAAFSAAVASAGPQGLEDSGRRGGPDMMNAIAVSLNGVSLAQLAVGVLGVLLISGEHSTGMIRSTLMAVPRRLPVLWSKAALLTLVTVTLTIPAAFAAFGLSQWILRGTTLQAGLADPGVARAIIGAGLYLSVTGLLGLGLGAILRSTAGAITTLVALLLIAPVLVLPLPSNWQQTITPYLPGNAGQAVWTLAPAS
ncbi:MAG: ABC transporter permease, partial [Nitriliruptorales bacterium]|nr:ABC transporter permease [Nitriliruptorales bacterium]